MCSFVSWIEYKNNIIYLNDDCLRDKKGRELKKHLGENFQDDIKGYGAIRWYFDLKDNKGVNEESESINTKDYPEQIVEDIKNCKMTLIGYNFRFLTDSALKDYLAIKNIASKSYLAIKKSAWKDFIDIKKSVYKDYLVIKKLKYFIDIKKSAYKDYSAIENSAYKDYLAIKNSAFWDLFKIKKNRIKQWQ